MKRLRLLVPLLAMTAWLVPPFALAAESARSESFARDFGRPCKTPPAQETEPSGPGIVLPRFTPANPPRWPGYPKEARKRGQQGTVKMLLLVNEEGRVSRARVVRSTGYPALDQVGLDATRDWKIAPGSVDGKVQCIWREFELSWTLYADDFPREAVQLAEAMLTVQFYRLRLEAVAEKRAPEKPAVMQCFRNAELNEVRDAYASAFFTALTRAELKEALAFFYSPAGQSYAASGQWHRSIAGGALATEKPPSLTDVEFAAVGAFFTTSAGSKLVDREQLKADRLEEDVTVRLRPLIHRCLRAASSQG
jgi:TonB family protein